MSILRRAILAFALIAGIAPVIAQAPGPVPALPDAERRISYTIAASTCACSLGANLPLYGDSTDYQNWIEVFLNGVRVNFNDPTFGWTLAPTSGSFASLARPITNAVLTFNSVQTGTVQIVGARRPRRTTQFQENVGVSARNLNVAFSDLTTQTRELWDKTNDITGRALLGLPGETITALPSASQRAGGLLAFDALGNPVMVTPGVGTGNVVGPGISVNSDVACWNGTTGAILKDCGAIGTTTLTGDVTGGPAVGTVPTALATVNANVGSWGSTTAVPFLTVDAKGRITAASNITITPANIGAVPATRQVLGGAGMTAGGPLSSDVTLGLATIPNNTILANNSGGLLAPGNLTASQILDMLGAVQGDVLCRNATQWVVLPPGTNGQLLTTGGPAANCSWTTASGTGTMTQLNAGAGITLTPSPITSAGSVAITAPVTAPLGGTGVISPATHTLPINQGASAQNNTGTGSLGQCVASNGASADPSFQSGCRVLLGTLTASNSATLNDSVACGGSNCLTSSYNDYEIVFENVLPATATATCEIQLHSGGAYQTSSYLSAAGFFTGGSNGNALPTAYVACNNASGTTGSSTVGINGFARIHVPSQTSFPKMLFGQFIQPRSATNVDLVQSAGMWTGGNGAIDGFQILFSSGNITTGTVKIYGFK